MVYGNNICNDVTNGSDECENPVNKETELDRLVSRLLSAPKVFPRERAVIATLADNDVIGAPGFAEQCVVLGEWAYVRWPEVVRWADGLSRRTAWVRKQAAAGLSAQGYDEVTPPQEASTLQVVLTLDDPKGWIIAAWRDLYAERDLTTEVDMCLDHLTGQHLCWDCGNLGVVECNELFWCATCQSNEKSK